MLTGSALSAIRHRLCQYSMSALCRQVYCASCTLLTGMIGHAAYCCPGLALSGNGWASMQQCKISDRSSDMNNIIVTLPDLTWPDLPEWKSVGCDADTVQESQLCIQAAQGVRPADCRLLSNLSKLAICPCISLKSCKHATKSARQLQTLWQQSRLWCDYVQVALVWGIVVPA